MASSHCSFGCENSQVQRHSAGGPFESNEDGSQRQGLEGQMELGKSEEETVVQPLGLPAGGSHLVLLTPVHVGMEWIQVQEEDQEDLTLAPPTSSDDYHMCVA